MKDKNPPKRKGARKRSHLIGLDLHPNKDGGKRITKGEKFTLVGGNEQSHEAMTESVVKTFETLKRKGRTLESADPREVAELLQKHYPRT